jgi:hypothetical protein
LAQRQAPAAIAANAQSFDQKMALLEQAAQQPQPSEGVSQGAEATTGSEQAAKAEVHNNSSETGAVLAESLGTAGGVGSLSVDSNIGSGAPTIKDQQVSFEGDVVHGQFLTEIAGKDVWVTVSGHLG